MTGHPLRITAHMSGPIVDMPLIILDGLLAWSWVELAKADRIPVPPISDRFAADFPLPLERWEEGGTWGWCCSAGIEDVIGYTSVEVRRKPATEAMARYSTAAKNHAGLGPTKARDTTLPARHARTVTWEALVTDQADLERLLGPLTNISARWRNGFGRVDRWLVEPGTPDGWRQRPMPHPEGQPRGVRAPYWHPTRQHPCL